MVDITKNLSSLAMKKLANQVGVACEITSSCNANCLHCSIDSKRTESNNELTTAEWKEVIDQSLGIGGTTISFTGGEPLLRNDLEELITYATENGLNTSVLTNGYKLDEKRIKLLESVGLKLIMISLDGADATTHDNFRGVKGLFDRAINALSFLRNTNIASGVIITITKGNFNQGRDILELSASLGVNQIKIVGLCRVGRAKLNPFLEPDPNDYIQSISQIYECEKELENCQVKYPNLPMIFFEKSIGVQNYLTLKKEGKLGICGAGLVGCAISSIGDVKPCNMSMNKFGNIREEPLEVIWNNENFKLLRNTIYSRDITPCNDCRFIDICLAGCRALSYQIDKKDGVFSADVNCVKCYNTFKEDIISI